LPSGDILFFCCREINTPVRFDGDEFAVVLPETNAEAANLAICRTAFRILRNRQEAEDAAQRAFQRAFTNLARFRGDSAFSTWVTRVAINEALMVPRLKRTATAPSETNHDDIHAPLTVTVPYAIGNSLMGLAPAI
jgi:GGDEF domain-containing protein